MSTQIHHQGRPPHNMQHRPKKKNPLFLTLIAVNALVLLVVVGMVVWMFFPTTSAGYRDGVAKADEITLPTDMVVLNSLVAHDNQTVYVASLQKKGNKVKTVALKRKLNKSVEYLELKNASAQELYDNPNQILCEEISDIECADFSDEDVEEVSFGEVTFVRTDAGKWSGEDVEFAADTIVGITSDTVIGARFASQSENESLPQDTFDRVTYFERETGKPRSAVELEQPSYITATKDGVLVTEVADDLDADDIEKTVLSLEADGGKPEGGEKTESDEEQSEGDDETEADDEQSERDDKTEADDEQSEGDDKTEADDEETARHSYFLVPADGHNRIDKPVIGDDDHDKGEDSSDKERKAAPDAIRKVDLLNSLFSQGLFTENCPDALSKNQGVNQDSIPGLQIPEGPNDCWIKLNNGIASPTVGPKNPELGPCVDSQKIDYTWYKIFYADINGDGYEDAYGFGTFEGCFSAGPAVTVWIFDPEHPDRPYLYYDLTGTAVVPDTIKVEGSDVIASFRGCPTNRLSFSAKVGAPAQKTWYDAETCISH